MGAHNFLQPQLWPPALYLLCCTVTTALATSGPGSYSAVFICAYNHEIQELAVEVEVLESVRDKL